MLSSYVAKMPVKKALYEKCRRKGMENTFEFSEPRTPQSDGKIARKFRTFYGRIRSMLKESRMKSGLEYGQNA